MIYFLTISRIRLFRCNVLGTGQHSTFYVMFISASACARGIPHVYEVYLPDIKT